MSRMRFARFLVPLTLPTLLVAACGGSTESDANSGTGGAGGSSAAGSSAAGSGTAGTGTAGTGTAGSGTAGTGTAGSSSVDWSKCTMPGECMLAANNCCGSCGAPTIGQVDAVNVGKSKEHFTAVCPHPEDVACPGCASMDNPDLVAMCALGQGKCVAVELSKSPFTECAQESDCVLRYSACCECGATGLPSAFAKTQLTSYLQSVCSPLADCADCIPQYPAGAKAVCDAGHCKAVFPNGG